MLENNNKIMTSETAKKEKIDKGENLKISSIG